LLICSGTFEAKLRDHRRFFAAIIDLSDDVTFKNSGVVESNDVSIQVSSSSFGAFTLVNSGTIIGEVKALSPNAPVTIANSGLIEAIVNLGDAADTLVNFVKHGKLIKSGTITGVIDLGGGESTRVTNISTGARSPRWRPDGKALLFTSTVFPGADCEFSNRRSDLAS